MSGSRLLEIFGETGDDPVQLDPERTWGVRGNIYNDVKLKMKVLIEKMTTVRESTVVLEEFLSLRSPFSV